MLQGSGKEGGQASHFLATRLFGVLVARFLNLLLLGLGLLGVGGLGVCVGLLIGLLVRLFIRLLFRQRILLESGLHRV